MDITLTLALPRDRMSVPLVRRILGDSLTTLGLVPGHVDDIGLALTEACTNVLDHADGSEEYEVSAHIDEHCCTIEVIDRGGGGFTGGDGAVAADTDEGGRGILIMGALVDRLEFTRRETAGTVVHLEKHLEWTEGSVLSKMRRRTGR